ncbi:MAG: hypothetical protein HRU19_05020 [Pseudobacteriovorax sp.]|nr:hypothetical protein [Pseudobacteriovorax sp.]
MSQAKAANSSSYITPWITSGLDYDEIRLMKETLSRLQQQVATKYLNKWQTLEALSKKKNKTLTMNQLRKAKNILTGASNSSMYYQPILCSTGKSYFFGLNAVGEDGLMRSLVMNQVKVQIKKDHIEQIESALKKFIDSWEQPIQPSDQSSSLKLGLTLKRGSLSHDQGELNCMNLRLAESLHTSYRISTSTGLEQIKFIQGIVGSRQSLSRVNRSLNTVWSYKDSKWNAKVSLSESIFGNKIGPDYTWSMSGDEPRLPLDQGLNTVLTNENAMLSEQTNPEVVKILGAWAYLSKGRAWGLELNDRLVSSSAPDAIKGHIVGFFGPKKNLRTTTGQPVHEGAILYIRKGARKIRMGETWIFDQKTYPTPWPPGNK